MERDRPPDAPRLLDRVRDAIRTRNYSRSTSKTYVSWIRRFIVFHGKRHPAEMGKVEISQFLTSLATQRNVSASTQNQALAALLFLYRDVLGQEVELLQGVTRAKERIRLPVVLAKHEVQAVLQGLRGTRWLMATLMYGSGIRLMECCRLRVKDMDLTRREITVRDGKGRKDRVTLIPECLVEPLANHLRRVRLQHEQDLRRGAGYVELPYALARKYPNAVREWPWQWVFPATRTYIDPETGHRRRHHLHQSVLQRAVKEAVRLAWNLEARQLSQLSPRLRHPPPRKRLRHPNHPGTPRPQRCEHHDDLCGGRRYVAASAAVVDSRWAITLPRPHK